MATVGPVIEQLPTAPNRGMSSAQYPIIADAWAAKIGPWTTQVNATTVWMGQAVDLTYSARDAAAASAAAALASAGASSGAMGAAQAARDAAAAFANSAALSAAAAGSAAGLPAVAGHAGQALVVRQDESGFELAVLGQAIGDLLITSRTPDASYLPADGSVFSQSAYPLLFGQVGLISDLTRAVRTAITMPSSTYWTGMAYGAGRFVAITGSSIPTANGQNGQATAVSTDGLTWTAGGSLPIGAYWRYVRWCNNKFIATYNRNGSGVGSTTCAVSSDGLTWTSVTLPANRQWSDVAFGNGKYVMLCAVDGITDQFGTGTVVLTSTDAVTWTPGTMPVAAHWGNIVFGNGKFVAVGGINGLTGSNAAAVSTDGITWTPVTLPASATWSLEYGLGIFVITAPGINRTLFSKDGINWSIARTVTGAEFGGGKIVAGQSSFLITGGGVGAPTSVTYCSANGAIWYPAGILNSSADWQVSASNGNRICSVARNLNGTDYTNVASSLLEFFFDRTTQFATPTAPVSSGAEAYIKAKAVA
ncbi:hypothetical protein AABC73_07065 [Pseudomonas sp. G.S.17]|uniref:hypothetical protein n=1 Tax=Pseudomonas sp. G.S.17 TaxID=3137451 RepID=UPI00311C9947